MASKFTQLFNKRGAVMLLSVAVSFALAKAGLQFDGTGFFDGPR